MELIEKPDSIILSVIDQGAGIPREVRRELVHRGRTDSRPGVRGETGTGYGFQLMHFFMRSFGGSVQWQSTSIEDASSEGATPTGTRFDFTLKRSGQN